MDFACVYLAHQIDRAVVSNLECQELTEVGTCGGLREERNTQGRDRNLK